MATCTLIAHLDLSGASGSDGRCNELLHFLRHPTGIVLTVIRQRAVRSGSSNHLLQWMRASEDEKSVSAYVAKSLKIC